MPGEEVKFSVVKFERRHTHYSYPIYTPAKSSCCYAVGAAGSDRAQCWLNAESIGRGSPSVLMTDSSPKPDIFFGRFQVKRLRRLVSNNGFQQVQLLLSMSGILHIRIRCDFLIQYALKLISLNLTNCFIVTLRVGSMHCGNYRSSFLIES